VQDAVSDQSELVARHLIEENGYIYVCGGLEMGRAVKHSIAQALVRHPDISNAATEIAAKRLVARLLASHQIVTELW
jgi:sulfite reductase alpha subunit-like flavoprotein